MADDDYYLWQVVWLYGLLFLPLALFGLLWLGGKWGAWRRSRARRRSSTTT